MSSIQNRKPTLNKIAQVVLQREMQKMDLNQQTKIRKLLRGEQIDQQADEESSENELESN